MLCRLVRDAYLALLASMLICVMRVTYGVHGNDLTGGLLHLTELTNEVPETRLGDRLVDGEDPHAVELGRGLLLGGKVASNHHVLSEASHLEDCGGRVDDAWCRKGSRGQFNNSCRLLCGK